jgi:Putative Flp pilus-assembly TadE/G-like
VQLSSVREVPQANPPETKMKLRFRNCKGQVAILMTLAVATLLGVISLASDVGVLYFSSIQLQKAADAAALAGASYFGPNSPPSPTCNWGATNAQNGACDYVINNGIAKGYITAINSPASGVASGSGRGSKRPGPTQAPISRCFSAACWACPTLPRLVTRPRLGRCRSPR